MWRGLNHRYTIHLFQVPIYSNYNICTPGCGGKWRWLKNIRPWLNPMVLTDEVATGLALLIWANAYKKSRGDRWIRLGKHVYKCMIMYFFWTLRNLINLINGRFNLGNEVFIFNWLHLESSFHPSEVEHPFVVLWEDDYNTCMEHISL